MIAPPPGISFIVAMAWRAARFRGDRAFLAALHLLSGIGFILMVSLLICVAIYSRLFGTEELTG